MTYKDNIILQQGLEMGIIDLLTVEAKLEQMNRQKYLAMHPYSMWQGTNGKWYTRLPCENGSKKNAEHTDIRKAHHPGSEINEVQAGRLLHYAGQNGKERKQYAHQADHPTGRGHLVSIADFRLAKSLAHRQIKVRHEAGSHRIDGRIEG